MPLPTAPTAPAPGLRREMSADAAALDRDAPRDVPDVRVLPAVALRVPDRDDRELAELDFPELDFPDFPDFDDAALALAFFDRDADVDVRERVPEDRDAPDRVDEDPPDARDADVRVPVLALEAMPTD
ncbi:hypothetical protein QNM97_12640 [Gordonia sp. L191]|uniref:hypothetical protein n=1 Tax=Gordonia sp. L191 TaxID=2982699 RepID=UPI0024BFB10A|nr:hypothetical protein [Gordonia sp. L191]WHU49753.1 hypothetical protein QNM97_12640 [Gordonia sp. L191]